MRKILTCLLLCSFFACMAPSENTESSAPSLTDSPNEGPAPTDGELRIAFYNVENLFDTEDNPEKIDEDFLPEGKYAWTPEKYQVKLKNLARVIKGIQPDIIGLAEIENRKVLEDLCAHPLIADQGYRIVHEESPDMRGIDVALLYRSEAFRYLDHSAQRVNFPLEQDYTSRDFLLVAGQVKGGENLYLIVNHWPSRRGGMEESQPRRLQVASQVRGIVDQLYGREQDANIVLMGDFNDDPDNRSITEVLKAKSNWEQKASGSLLNLMSDLSQKEDEGSLYYDNNWNLFDQFMVSGHLLDTQSSFGYVNKSVDIFNPDWLRVGYGKASLAPKRAIFRGEFQPDGFSDHFPIAMDLLVK